MDNSEKTIVNPLNQDSELTRLLFSGQYNRIFQLCKDKTDAKSIIFECLALGITGSAKEALRLLDTNQHQFVNGVWKFNFLDVTAFLLQILGMDDLALAKRLEAMEQIKSLGDDPSIKASEIRTLSNIGILYLNKAQYDNAEHIINKAHQLALELDDKDLIGLSYSNLRILYIRKNDYSRAIEFALYAYEHYKNKNNLLGVADQLFLLVYLNNRVNHGQALYYLEELESIIPRLTESTTVESIPDSRIARALYHASSRRLKDKMKAQSIFEEIVNEPQTQNSSKMMILPPLIELLLVEYQAYREPEVMQEIENYLRIIYHIADQSKRIDFITQARFLSSEFSAIKRKFNEAEKTLTDTLDLLHKKGITYYDRDINERLKSLTDELVDIRRLSVEHSDFINQIENNSLLDYLQQAKKQALDS